ncbi:MmcQ/YjbR family DNA-binding protein [Agrococcus sp. ARC_14]|uniref:MmcQ/YjbR family DNA-binding protein n=1 Tax=Agrococcus sp. ARC_14 TaxID=2919927 RepID=UPI001F07012B|nr:MmcQ/YjbR family DNA-binding protein [Agrococcus sp. ARC_14]MCH1883849.1 MmcQ/YjbR family DNA-binding protein [Agrococcus sp. ARC_14]
MAHPLMFDADDPLLARLRELALAFPGAAEKVSHGRPAFFTTKVFAYYGGTTKQEHNAGLHPPRLSVLLEPDERLALLDEGALVPAYLGPSGWVAVDLQDPDWVRVAELLDSSFRVTATKRLVAELDARRPHAAP